MLDDENVRALYASAADASEVFINDSQRNSVTMLGNLAKQGNEEASKALLKLSGKPGLHPLLREMIGSMMHKT